MRPLTLGSPVRLHDLLDGRAGPAVNLLKVPPEQNGMAVRLDKARERYPTREVYYFGSRSCITSRLAGRADIGYPPVLNRDGIGLRARAIEGKDLPDQDAVARHGVLLSACRPKVDVSASDGSFFGTTLTAKANM